MYLTGATYNRFPELWSDHARNDEAPMVAPVHAGTTSWHYRLLNSINPRDIICDFEEFRKLPVFYSEIFRLLFLSIVNWIFCSIIIHRKHLPYSLSFWRRRKSYSLKKIPGPILWWNNAHVSQGRTSLHRPIYCRAACGLHYCWIDWDSVVPHYIRKIGTCPYRLVVDMVSWRSIPLQSDFHFFFFNVPGSNLCVSFP